jgi:hypothetical protein
MTFAAAVAFLDMLPGIARGVWWGQPTWRVGKGAVAWKRPFSKADLRRFEDQRVPEGDILAVQVESLDAKEAVLSMRLAGVFTIPHFDGFPAVLVELKKAKTRDVRFLITQAWKHRVAEAQPKTKSSFHRSRSR